MVVLLAALALVSLAAGDELVVLLLDTSGSMSGQEAAMVEGTNALLANMSKTMEANQWNGTFNVQIYAFSDNSRHLVSEGPLRNHPGISLAQYRCSGGTPLFDVLGETLQTIRNGSTIILATDGEDTTSYHFTRKDIAALIDTATKERDIQFLYIYKGQEAFDGGQGLGFVGPQGIPGPAVAYAAAAVGATPLGHTLASISVSASAPMFRHLDKTESVTKDEL